MGIRTTTTRLVWRKRAAEFARRLAVCLLVALLLATVVSVLDRLIYLNVNVYLVSAGLLAAAAVAALAWTASGAGADRLAAAVAADRRLGLGDRLSSALQLARRGGPWAEAVVDDAEEHARDVRPSDVFPFAPTLPARLLVPGMILLGLVWVLPPADLLGRMRREAESVVAAEAEGRRGERALRSSGAADAAAGLQASAGAKTGAGGLGGLRLTLVKIEKDLAAGKLDDAKRIELSEHLRRLAGLMSERRAGPALTESLNRTAAALNQGDRSAAAKMLRAAQNELARLEDALKKAGAMDAHMKKLAAKAREALRASAAPASAQPLPPTPDPAGGLVEQAPLARQRGADERPVGILYSSTAAARGAAATKPPWAYDDALDSARNWLEEQRLPADYVRLVQDYFSSIKPADR